MTIMKRKLARRVPLLTFAALALASTSSTVMAADWRYLTSSTSGTVVLVDVESARELPALAIRRPFPVMQIWVKMDFSRDKSEKYREWRALYRFNCTAETSMLVSSATYAPDGRVVKSSASEDYDFRYEQEVPDTIGYDIMEFACGRRRLG
jgi:hypothetical protein